MAIEIAQGRRLVDITGGTGLEHRAHDVLFVVDGQRKHLDLRNTQPKRAGDFDTVHPGQADVEHQHIGTLRQREFDTLRRRAPAVRVRWAHLLGAAWLAGIGFTMSLFISQLAFGDPVLVEEAKLGILLGSGLSAAIGLVWLYVAGSARVDAGQIRAVSLR